MVRQIWTAFFHNSSTFKQLWFKCLPLVQSLYYSYTEFPLLLLCTNVVMYFIPIVIYDLVEKSDYAIFDRATNSVRHSLCTRCYPKSDVQHTV